MFKSKLMLRPQLLIDPNVQLPILQRTVLYTCACAVYFMVVLFFSESGKINHESPWKSLGHCFDVIACWAPGLTMLAPIIAYDLLIFTNRFAGPMFRIRREMELLIKDESVNEVKLRDKDHWMDVADLFNEIRSELIELREARSPMAKSLFGAVSADSGSLDSTELEAVKPKAVKLEAADQDNTDNSSTDSDEESALDQPPSSNSASEFSAENVEMPTVTKPQNAQDQQSPSEDSPVKEAETATEATEEVLGRPVQDEDKQSVTAEASAGANA